MYISGGFLQIVGMSGGECDVRNYSQHCHMYCKSFACSSGRGRGREIIASYLVPRKKNKDRKGVAECGYFCPPPPHPPSSYMREPTWSDDNVLNCHDGCSSLYPSYAKCVCICTCSKSWPASRARQVGVQKLCHETPCMIRLQGISYLTRLSH